MLVMHIQFIEIMSEKHLSPDSQEKWGETLQIQFKEIKSEEDVPLPDHLSFSF